MASKISVKVLAPIRRRWAFSLENLRHARELIAAWRNDYNHHRPHTSLDGLTPWEYHQRSVKDQTLNRAN